MPSAKFQPNFSISLQAHFKTMVKMFRPVWLVAVAISLMVFGNDAYAIVGATMPFTSVEAESGGLAGGAIVRSLAAPPTNQFMSPEIEASSRAFVELKG